MISANNWSIFLFIPYELFNSVFLLVLHWKKILKGHYEMKKKLNSKSKYKWCWKSKTRFWIHTKMFGFLPQKWPKIRQQDLAFQIKKSNSKRSILLWVLTNSFWLIDDFQFFSFQLSMVLCYSNAKFLKKILDKKPP